MKRKKITYLLIAIFSAMSLSAFCQQTINVSSHSANINGLKFDYSIGEIALITTERNVNLIVTQGLLQPTTGVGNQPNANQGNSQPLLGNTIKVYPNPVGNILFVESNETDNVDISYQLFDAAGKLIFHENTKWTAGPNRLSLDLKSYAAGAYYLMLRKLNTQESFSYKIQKTN